MSDRRIGWRAMFIVFVLVASSPSEACAQTCVLFEPPQLDPVLERRVHALASSVEDSLACQWDEGRQRYTTSACTRAYRRLSRAPDLAVHAVGRALVRAFESPDDEIEAERVRGLLSHFGDPTLPLRTLPTEDAIRYLVRALAQPRGNLRDPRAVRRLYAMLSFYSMGRDPAPLGPWDDGRDVLGSEASRRALVCAWSERMSASLVSGGQTLEDALTPWLSSPDLGQRFYALACIGHRTALREVARASLLELSNMSVPEQAWSHFAQLARVPPILSEDEWNRVTGGRRTTYVAPYRCPAGRQ